MTKLLNITESQNFCTATKDLEWYQGLPQSRELIKNSLKNTQLLRTETRSFTKSYIVPSLLKAMTTYLYAEHTKRTSK